MEGPPHALPSTVPDSLPPPLTTPAALAPAPQGSSAADHVTLLAQGGFNTHTAPPTPPSPQSMLLLLLPTAPFRLLCSRPLGLRPPNSPANTSACAAVARGLSAAATAVARSLDEDRGPSVPAGGSLREPDERVGGLQGVLQCWLVVGAAAGGVPMSSGAADGPWVAGRAGLLAVASAGGCWGCGDLADKLSLLLLLLLVGEQMAALMAANLRRRGRSIRVMGNGTGSIL